jgi:hypothetical protein
LIPAPTGSSVQQSESAQRELTNDEKRAHLTHIRREHLIDHVCPQEILPPQK